jgi:hypothetical protein
VIFWGHELEEWRQCELPVLVKASKGSLGGDKLSSSNTLISVIVP